jgi:hypothetical protein
MEPAKLNSPDPADAKLEALLREHASDALPDDGFSQRVMAVLPEAEPSRRAALLPPPSDRFVGWSSAEIAGAAGAVVLLIAQVSGFSVSAGLRQFGTDLSRLIEAALDPSLLLILGLTIGVLFFMADEAGEASA